MLKPGGKRGRALQKLGVAAQPFRKTVQQGDVGAHPFHRERLETGVHGAVVEGWVAGVLGRLRQLIVERVLFEQFPQARLEIIEPTSIEQRDEIGGALRQKALGRRDWVRV